MRIATFIAIAIIAWAAFISVANNLSAPNFINFGASTILILAVAVQRINGVQRWIASPKNRRKQLVEAWAQQVLINLCDRKQFNDELRDLRVHVWEVPLWYRRIFPYALRIRLKQLIQWRGLRWSARWQWRPVLVRVAAVGLVKPVPTGVQFRKGVGLIGVCIANNDSSKMLKLRIMDPTYRAALNDTDDTAWKSLDPSTTHNLELKQAVALSRSYGQVIARVIQDPETGEAIGCATISLKSGAGQTIRLTTSPEPKRELRNLASNAGNALT